MASKLKKTILAGFILQKDLTHNLRRDLQEKTNLKIAAHVSTVEIGRLTASKICIRLSREICHHYGQDHPALTNCLAVECTTRNRSVVDKVMTHLSTTDVHQFGLYMPHVITTSRSYLPTFNKLA